LAARFSRLRRWRRGDRRKRRPGYRRRRSGREGEAGFLWVAGGGWGRGGGWERMLQERGFAWREGLRFKRTRKSGDDRNSPRRISVQVIYDSFRLVSIGNGILGGVVRISRSADAYAGFRWVC